MIHGPTILAISVCALIVFFFGFAFGILWHRRVFKREVADHMSSVENYHNSLMEHHSEIVGNHLQWFQRNIIKDFARAQADHQEKQMSGYYHGSDDGDEEENEDDDDEGSDGMLN